jgi:DNA-binding GntR family transcriptional regulator
MESVHYVSLGEQVYSILKRSILERQLSPNSKLDINALGQQLGVSRRPILDALTRLEAEGLVIFRNRVGTFVTPLDKTMFEEIFEARDMIEQWASSRIVANLRGEDVMHLRALLQETGQLLAGVTEQTFDYRRSIELDQQFHLALIHLCGNSRVIEQYSSLNSHMQIVRAYSLRALKRSQEGQVEHEAILEAFTARNVERAQAAQSHHTQRSRIGVLALLDQYGVL